MKNWILDHLRLFTAIVVFGVTVIVVGIVMITSYTSYKNYEKTYYQNDLDMRSLAAAAPKNVEINDNFKSKYNIKLVSEGTEAKVNLEAKSFADIDVVFKSEATDNLLGNMTIKVNNSLIEEDDIAVDNEDWHHLVMSNFALPEGELTVVIESVKNKTMPEIQSITFYTSAAASLA